MDTESRTPEGRTQVDASSGPPAQRTPSSDPEAGVPSIKAAPEELPSDHLAVIKAQLFKTLGHPERIRILEVLSVGEHAVVDLLRIVKLTPPSLSQHLAILRHIGIIERRRHHQRVVYRLTHPKTADLLAVARSLLGELDRDKRRAGRQNRGP